ncbi:carboxylesterase/lipase family protein [Streptomyces sp. NPDC050658]|uniref:carboxylesterase/lipase family protein n=1 Tax=unclassified Streptomyces TaxID=2593676 RepID=UPI00343A7075
MNSLDMPPNNAGSSTRSATGHGGTVVVRITEGRIAGERLHRVTVFRGIPYAAPPVGPLRFASPMPPEPWKGVRDAIRFGAPALQTDYVPDGSEDCLYANVWTPDVHGCRPLLVYIHGGGWAVGAGSEPDYDGARLAERGDLVVVTFNYRLGLIGWGLHEAFTDIRTGSCSNWGLQDQMALLRWIQANAPAFGGDPGNITLVGASAGGSSVWQLSLLPELRSVVRRAVPISAKHVWNPASSTTPAESRAVYAMLARQFGCTVEELRAIPGTELKEAWEELFSRDPVDRPFAGWREYRGPVPDGQWMRGYDHDRPTPRVPLLVLYCRTEGTFFTTGPGYPFDGPLPEDEAGLRDAVALVLRKCRTVVTDELVEGCLGHYREAAVADGLPSDPVALWTEIWGDSLFRHQILRQVERHARFGWSPVYAAEFAHPLQPPHRGTPHEAASKFLFGSHMLPANATAYGSGELDRMISDVLIDLVASFARGEEPNGPHTPAWKAYTPDQRSTLIIGGEQIAVLAKPVKERQLRYWDRIGHPPRS